MQYEEAPTVTRRDFLTKWFIYALALLPVWFLEVYVLSRLKFFGVSPMLLPVAAVTVAVLEGSAAGGAFGLAVGVICDAVYHTNGAMTLGMTLLGAGTGIIAQYGVRQSLAGCLACSAGALVIIDLCRVVWRLAAGVSPLQVLLGVALPEVLYSLVLVPLVYLVFRWVHNRTQFATLF